MGFEDRTYSRREGPNPWGWLYWLVSGSVPLFTFSGIRVRAHASMVVLIVLVLLFGLGQGFTFSDRILSMSVLFLVVLLHEFGHCFGARAVGGHAEEIMMSPLGGLAFAHSPNRPFPTFITVAAGPAVNVLFILLSAIVIYSVGGKPAWNPFSFAVRPENRGEWFNIFWYASWFFSMNYWLLLFNLLPSFPLDGGRLLQSALWKPLGYYKSMLYSVTIGIGGAALMFIWGLITVQLLLAFVGVSCFLTCLNLRQQLLAGGPWAFQDEDTDYSAAQWNPKASAAEDDAETRRAQKRAAQEEAEQRKIDAILEKVHQKGMHSLNFLERRALKQATERQRQRTLKGRR